MLAIGRLNGNNLRFGSIDLTTSQMYTGTSPLPGLHSLVLNGFDKVGLFIISVPLFFFASPISTGILLLRQCVNDY